MGGGNAASPERSSDNRDGVRCCRPCLVRGATAEEGSIMRTHKFVLGVLICALLALASLAAMPASASATTQIHEVQVPVVFDGIHYSAAEFNALTRSLNGRALYYAIMRAQPSVLYAFSS